MGFGEDLWDKWDDVMKLSDDHIKEMAHMREFLKEQSKLEAKFSLDLKTLIQKYQRPQKHSLETFKQIYESTSLGKAWNFLLSQSLNIAATHDEVSREITDGPINTLKEVIKGQEKEKKGYALAGQNKLSAQKKAVSILIKARDDFHSASKAAERERQAAEQYNQTPNKTQDRVKQFTLNVQKAEKKVAQAQGKYDDQILVLNKFNANHHEREMPQIFQQVEVAMSSRIDTMKQVIIDVAESQNTKMPSLHENIDSIKAQGQSVSQAEDLVSVCNMMQTGPMAYEVFFEDFDPTGGNRARKKLASTRSGSAIQNNNRTPVKKSSIDFTRLPPEQRDDAMMKRLTEIDSELAKIERDKIGVESLVTNYRENPSFGDVAVAEKQLAEINSQARTLHEERDEIKCKHPGAVTSGGQAQGGELPPGWVQATDNNGIVYYYREDGGPSQYEHPGESLSAGDEFADAPEFGEAPPEAVGAGGRVKAMYEFADEGEGLLQMKEGEVLDVIANEGDGWVHVANSAGRQGYVPEGYLVPA